MADLLSHRFTVHVLTRRGVGASGDGDTYDIEHEYDDIIAVLNATGSRRLVGHSFGAICALGAALRSPALERLALYEPPLNIQEAVVPEDALAEIEEADTEGDVARVLEIGLSQCVRLSGRDVDILRRSAEWADMERHAVRWAREQRAIHDLPPGAERYAGIRTRTLLLVGETTQRHHRDAIETLAQVLPHATSVELSGVGHEANVLAPDTLAATIEGFLS